MMIDTGAIDGYRGCYHGSKERKFAHLIFDTVLARGQARYYLFRQYIQKLTVLTALLVSDDGPPPMLLRLRALGLGRRA
jgi:hypothetical protein